MRGRREGCKERTKEGREGWKEKRGREEERKEEHPQKLCLTINSEGYLSNRREMVIDGSSKMQEGKENKESVLII